VQKGGSSLGGGSSKMLKHYIEFFTYVASHKTKLLDALNTTFLASLILGLKALNNDIELPSVVKQNKPKGL
jgi:hypothetical protein